MVAGYPRSLAKLIDVLKKLPGIGHKTAQRLAFYIMKLDQAKATELAQAILDVRKDLVYCSQCFILTDKDPCDICSDPRRDHSLILVVEELQDFLTIERMGEFKGVYHILGGSISPLEGRTPDDLKIRELIQRLHQDPSAREVILATNPNVEGEATAIYLARMLKPLGVKITRIARGLPVGADIEFADEMTMLRALEGRQEIT
ncbi:recombination protein RecR [bacterium]|nr:recombination protein RecR [bacterium]